MPGGKSRPSGADMGRPAWKPASPDLVLRFAAIADRFAGAEKRKMFGYPCVFINGNMVAGVHGDQVFFRLAPPERESVLALEGAHYLEPMPGRPMKDYVVPPAGLLERDTVVAAWVESTERNAATLPPKIKPGK